MKFKISFIIAIGVVISILIWISYNKNNDNDLSSELSSLHVGYISIETKDLNDNTFLLDEVEWITLEDEDRIRELNLTIDNNLPNGYYIHNSDTKKTPIIVNEKTLYEFIDWSGIYVKEDGNKQYTTSDKLQFINNLNSYKGKKFQPLFWVEIKDGIVIKITEQLLL